MMDKKGTYSRLALCNILTTPLITSKSPSGTSNHKLNASINWDLTSLPGFAEMYVYGSSSVWYQRQVIKREFKLGSRCQGDLVR